MKKIILLGLCCLCLCGCESSWEKDFQASNIKIRIVEGYDNDDTYLSYSIKNISNYTCNGLKATIELKSGTITIEEIIYPPVFSSSPLKPNDVVEDESPIFNKNYDGYTATFKEIECYDKNTD